MKTENTIQDTSYNGWANYETWNVSLWIQNDKGLYNLAKGCQSYKDFIDIMMDLGSGGTLDNISWFNASLNISELDAMIQGMSDVFCLVCDNTGKLEVSTENGEEI